MQTREQLADLAAAWSSPTFHSGEASARLEAVLLLEGSAVPADLIGAAAEVGEALRVERPDAVRAAIQAFSAAIDWASIAAMPEVRFHGKLAIAMEDKARTTRKKLLSLVQEDLCQLLALAKLSGEVDAQLAGDLLLWLELADEQAKARLLPRFAKTDPMKRRLSPESATPIALRAAELVLQFGSLEEQVRWYFEASPVGELAKLAGLTAASLATRIGAAPARGVPIDVGGIEAVYYTAENFRPMLEVAFQEDPALFYELLAKACAVPSVQTHRAMAMTDAVPWERDLEIRSDKEVVRVRQHGPLVFSWSGAIGKSGKLELERWKSPDEAARIAETRTASAEARLGAKRSAPRFVLPKATKKRTANDHLKEAAGRFDRTTIRELVLAGLELNPICEDDWDRPPLFEIYSDPESVRLVLANGADPNGKDGGESTALEFSASTTTPESLESARLLLEAGTSFGAKGFRRAVESGNVELLEVLARHGRKPEASSLPALQNLAKEKRHHATLAFLQSLTPPA